MLMLPREAVNVQLEWPCQVTCRIWVTNKCIHAHYLNCFLEPPIIFSPADTSNVLHLIQGFIISDWLLLLKCHLILSSCRSPGAHKKPACMHAYIHGWFPERLYLTDLIHQIDSNRSCSLPHVHTHTQQSFPSICFPHIGVTGSQHHIRSHSSH